jgi:hypothetical protein
LFTILFGRLHIRASALTSGGSASDDGQGGWLKSIAGAGEYRMIVFNVLANCCWRNWPGVFGITTASQSCTRVVRCGWSWWWESCLARRATRSQVLTKGLRQVAKLSEVKVNVDCIAAEVENSSARSDRQWSLARFKRVRGGGVREGVEVGL